MQFKSWREVQKGVKTVRIRLNQPSVKHRNRRAENKEVDESPVPPINDNFFEEMMNSNIQVVPAVKGIT